MRRHRASHSSCRIGASGADRTDSIWIGRTLESLSFAKFAMSAPQVVANVANGALGILDACRACGVGETSSVGREPVQQGTNGPSILAEFRALEANLGRVLRGPDDLTAMLTQIHKTIFNVDLDRFDRADRQRWAASLMRGFFELRMKIKDAIPDWHRRRLITPAAERALRDTFRLCRAAGDMLGEMSTGFDRMGPGKETLRAFTGIHHNTQINPKYYDGFDIPFHSGDVLLVRGTAHNSAAIARIGNVDSQFSHVGIVHVEPSGKPYLVEALIESGSSITPLEEALNHDLGRAVLYRYRDPALAQAAAQFIHAKISKTLGRFKTPILYDFSMSLEGEKTLYCSKLVRLAYLNASRGKLALPTFKTRLDMQNRDFFERIGVTAHETFAPGDIDIEPEFDLVAEWQDYRMTPLLRMQDILMDKIFEWMELYGWRFEETPTIRLVSVLGKASSYLSEDAKNLLKSVLHKVPSNMSRRTISVIAMLHQTGQQLLESLEALEADTIRMKGRPMHSREAYAHLEMLRETSGGHIGYLAAP